MRKLRFPLLIFFLFCFGLTISFLGSYALFRTPETPVDSQYLMQFTDDESTYYLQKAASDIIFYVNSDSRDDYASLYTLQDSDGNEMPKLIKRDRRVAFQILPPEGGYEAGEQYILTLHDNAVFSGKELAGVKELVFIIEEEPVEKYTYQDTVKAIDSSHIEAIDENSLGINSIEVNAGDILLDETTKEAYKVIEVLENGNVIVDTPALDEIFEDLQVYGEYTWNVDDIEWNDELTVEIVENVRNSSFLRSLVEVAYAKEEDDAAKKAVGIKVKCEPDRENNTVKTEIKITFGPGKYGLFGISKLKHQEVTLTLEIVTGFSVFCNVDGPIYNPSIDISETSINAFSWSVSITAIKGSPLDKEVNAAKAIANAAEYKNIVGDLTKKFANAIKDKESGEIKLFKWTLPVPAIPLLSFDAEVLLFADLDVSAEATIGGSSESRTTSGLYFKNYKFRTYSDEYVTKSPITLSFMGKAKFKAGVKVELRANIISKKFAYIQIDPQAGLYGDLFVTWPVLDLEDMTSIDSVQGLYGYFESGLYFGADFEAAINLLLGKYDYKYELIEKKAPILTLGNKEISIGISPSRASVRALNNSFTAPDIIYEYYDVKKGSIKTKTVSLKEVKFKAGNQELEKNGRDVKIPAAGTSEFYVNALYKNPKENRTYSTIFKVIVSGSRIEGRVSAYNLSSDYEPIPNANVELYNKANRNIPITVTKTDENGKFSFNISEGTYILRIIAKGYKELISEQEIAQDETKFTEHILLIDDSQTGNGYAGGRINNAIDGRDLEGVLIRLRENWNNRTGNYFRDFRTTTDSYGQYRIDNIPSGYYTIEAVKDGFYTEYRNIIVHADEPQYDQNFTLSPELPEDQIRIVLRWGETPRDLDSHLIGNRPDGSEFNVFYSDMHYTWNGEEIANLDVDDTTSYGPETITILKPIEEYWVYAVHDYTNRYSTDSSSMSYSEAYVTVFTGGRQVATFNIPVGEVGTYWTVFEYVNGEIRPINSVNNIKPSSYQ